MYSFLFALGVSGVFFSVLFFIVSAIFQRPFKAPFICFFASLIALVLGVLLVLSTTNLDVSENWIIPSLLAPFTMLLLLSKFTIEAYRNRPLAKEREIKRISRKKEKELEVLEQRERKRLIEEARETESLETLIQKRAELIQKNEERQQNQSQKQIKKEMRKNSRIQRKQISREINEERREALKADWEENKRRRKLAKTIVSVQIIGGDSKTSTGSAIGRAVVGDFIAGPIGAIVGSGTAKHTRQTDFLITFADGHKDVETVPVNSMRYKELIQYL